MHRRIRILDAGGTVHWVAFTARRFLDADGLPDGQVSTFRLIDDEVAVEQAAEEARAQQARADALYRRSVENAGVGMCLITTEGRFAEVNDSLCRFFGYDAETLTTKTWQELTAPEYLEADVNKFNDVLAGRLESYRMVKQYIHADGKIIWGDLSVSCIRDERGDVEHFISQITDITARVEADEWNRALSQELKRQNALLHDSETTYRLLAENTTDAVIHGHNGKFVWASPAIEAVLGAPPEYWIGRDMSEVLPPEDRAAFTQRLDHLEAGATIQRRSRVVTVDGLTHWVHVHAAPFFDDDGRQIGFTSSLRVIDEEVAAENAAEQARAKQAQADALHRRSMESAAVGMCLARPEGEFLEVNEALCAFFGYDAETLLQKTWIELTAPEYLQADLDKVAELVAGHIDSYRMVKQFIHAEGHRLWGDLTVGCLRSDDGSIEVTIGQIADITDQMEAEQRLAESEERYRLLAENTGDVVTHVRDGIVVWASPSVEQVLGAPAEYWVGREVQEVVPPEDRPAFANRLAALARGESVMQRVRVVSRDGVTHWMHLHSRPFYDADGRWDGFIGSLRVIDEEVAAENAAEQARVRQSRADALYRRSMDSAAIGMCLARPEGPLLEVNGALCEFFGLDSETLLQKTWMELTAPEYLEADLGHVADLEAGRSDSYRMVKQYVHADGHRLWGDLSVGCLRRADGSVEVLIKQVTNITAQVVAEQRLERLARVDTLTGLANRGEVIARMESALEPTQGPQPSVGVLFCDVDGFKGINDKFGHAAGDTVLKTLASRVRHCVRDGDTAGRMGGDEMFVLLPGMPDIERVTRVAEKIRRHSAEPIRVGNQTISVTLSIGAVLAAPGQATSIVLARADSAMYAAKAQKNAVASFPLAEPS